MPKSPRQPLPVVESTRAQPLRVVVFEASGFPLPNQGQFSCGTKPKRGADLVLAWCWRGICPPFRLAGVNLPLKSDRPPGLEYIYGSTPLPHEKAKAQPMAEGPSYVDCHSQSGAGYGLNRLRLPGSNHA